MLRFASTVIVRAPACVSEKVALSVLVLPEVAPGTPLVQLPAVLQVPFTVAFHELSAARAQGARTPPAASASNTGIRIRRTEVNRGLEFMAGGMNGVEGAGMKKPRSQKSPPPRAERVCKRRKRLLNDRGTKNHIWGMSGEILSGRYFSYIQRKPTRRRSQQVYCKFFWGSASALRDSGVTSPHTRCRAGPVAAVYDCRGGRGLDRMNRIGRIFLKRPEWRAEVRRDSDSAVIDSRYKPALPRGS
jgi:hypothetical protein